ncbi:GD25917 [Drosophila simulans]|uniref:GD25917 n=1 Tax=Drosophila simulans TaxID=7240 RepID=B4QB73_DROSI|nr:GD25917 [Drosophila simulans]
MVDLTDAGSPFQQSIPDFAFYVPAIVVFTLAERLIQSSQTAKAGARKHRRSSAKIS